MTSRSVARGSAALVALSVFGVACSDSNDDAGVSTAVVDQPVTTDPAATGTDPTDSDPATTVAASIDGFVFTAPTGDYVITFPGEPTSTPLPIPLPTGQITSEAFIYEDGGDAAYFTSVFDYPEGSIDSDAETVLVGARDGAVANVGGTLIDSAFVDRDGVPGVEFNFEVADGANPGDGNALVFVDGLRLYQSFALGFSGQTEQFQAFLNSFMFTTDQAGDS